jgi:predicted regulator of Ras-like GTPase activity (Roadblock/LC7/MglB family)
MDATQALSELTALSAQITAVVVLDEQGAPAASTLDESRTGEVAESVKELVASAATAADRDGGLAQLEVATPAGSVFVVRDGKRTIAATTKPEPAAGLVFYDLKTTLRAIDDQPKPRPKPRERKKGSDAAA